VRKATLCVALLSLLACPSSAAIIGVAGGMGAPAATLGTYTMTPFPLDGRPLFNLVTDVPSPLGGTVDFSVTMYHVRVGSGWATWSHGYTGDVYPVSSSGPYSGTDTTLTLPAGTGAFYLYAEPNPFGLFDITAVAQDGTTVTQSVQGNSGASYYGFYGTGGDTIASIAVSSTVNFAIGEFGISQQIEGDLLIEKLVDPRGFIPPTTDWEFWVEPENDEPFLVTIAGGGGQLLLEDLEAGVYTVTETPKPGWEVAVASSDPGAVYGPFSATITVPPGGSVGVTFTNTLIPEPCTLTLLGLGALVTLRKRRSRR